ncbi:unnamed protein product, partial [Mesorhabditis belari]|uniref:Phosphorylated adapter RNA export protein n=1 Tax=Mesorhabditis belari TaxID=2138241 RepID=A0AAF3J210_9BILA
MYRDNREEKSDGEISSDDEEPVFKIPRHETTEVRKIKKLNTIWTDVLLEQELDRVGSVYMEENLRVERGSESFETGAHEGNHLSPRSKNQTTMAPDDGTNDVIMAVKPGSFPKEVIMPIPIVTVSPADDDPFAGPADLSQVESFGFDERKFSSSKYAKKRSPDGTQKPDYRIKSDWRSREKRTYKEMKESSKHLDEDFSLQKLFAMNFDEDLSIDRLGDEIALALGEKEPFIVLEIIKAIGREKAIELFDKTREVEGNGGLLVQDGSRKRTPGGVYINLFKQDPTISQKIKDNIILRPEDRQWKRAKRKGRRPATYEDSIREHAARLRELSKMDIEAETSNNSSERRLSADDRMSDD